MSGDTPTGDQPKTYITLTEPRRSWLIHCTDAWGNLGICMVEVDNGSIAIYAPDGSEGFTLGANGIAEFRAAYAEAIEVAEADLRARAAAAS